MANADNDDPYRDSPMAWFAQLLLALDRGEFQRAADAQAELLRLGWTVSYRKPPEPPSR